eukprot:TRINITY_DN2406_c0_g1_i15.p2 TRINITY_DN2406_c0_g1~~TRINITY_DN2406_c0_g1_i15.p2  ORF type:complete len:139 (+),score=28.84 TRINITY_DN2406_c0_g1_i15:498-914(+)
MKDLMSLLSHHHRVVVLSDEGKLMGYVTQSDLVKFLLDHDLLGDLGQRSLKELHLGTRRDDIISIGPREKVAEGFKKLILRKSHSVAVLDGEGKLVSGLDISNIKVTIHPLRSSLPFPPPLPLLYHHLPSHFPIQPLQ